MEYFDHIDTEEKAYFMGFFFADGYNSKSSLILNLSNKDVDILRKFSDMIFGEDRVKIYDRGNKGIEAVLGIYGKEICKRFAELGCPNKKTYTLQFPTWVKPELLRHFLRGYFDGDGSIILSQRRCKFTSSKIFNSRLKDILLLKFPDLTIFEYEESEHISSIVVYGYPSILKLLYLMYNGSNIHLDRKYERYQIVLSNVNDMIERMKKGTRGYSKGYLKAYDWYEKVQNM